MKLKAKNLNFSSGGPLIAVINQEDAARLDLRALDRIKIKKNNKEIIAAIDISEKKGNIHSGEIGLFEEIYKEFRIKDRDTVSVEQEPKPLSLSFIKQKLDGIELKKNEIDEIIKDIVNNDITEIEITYFVSACYIKGLSLNESAYLTEAIVKHGGKLRFNKKPILDKHCSGGVSGNRTTMIIVPIIAAAGFTIPKTSTRSITSPAGTSDTMEVLAPVAHSREKIQEIVKKTNGCMVWGGTLDLASADDKLIKIEKVLSLDPEGILLASVLAKKSAADSTHVLIDIPVGPDTKFKTKEKAEDLSKKFVELGRKLNLKIKTIISDGSQPIGNGIGPALEARDILLILQNKGPEDLKNKAVYMAGLMLEMVGVRNSYQKAMHILESGKAYEKMKEIIKAQGGNPEIKIEDIKLGKFKHEIKSEKFGIIKHINNELISRLAKMAGAPINKGAGVYLNVHLKDKIKKGEILFTIYAENKKKLKYSIEFCKKFMIIEIG